MAHQSTPEYHNHAEWLLLKEPMAMKLTVSQLHFTVELQSALKTVVMCAGS
jgi:hypothetical protein